MFDWREERLGAEGQSDEGPSRGKERGRIQSDEWVTLTPSLVREVDVEPLDYDLDISLEVMVLLEHLHWFNRQVLASLTLSHPP